MRIGAINPNVFRTRSISTAHGQPRSVGAARGAGPHLDSIEIAGVTAAATLPVVRRRLSIRARQYPAPPQWFIENLQAAHQRLAPNQRMLVEYKPFEPASYHTDIADWGMSILLSRHAGPQARCWWIRPPLSGAEHRADCGLAAGRGYARRLPLNDRRYADDDLTRGCMDPYQVFRIFHEIHFTAGRPGAPPTLPTCDRATTSRTRSRR